MEIISEWGIKITSGRKSEIFSIIKQWLESGKRGIQITGINAETVSLLKKQPLLARSINDSDIVNIDGIAVVYALRMYGYTIPERAACPDIFEMFLQEANCQGDSIYFLGAEEMVIRRMVVKIALEYPNLKIVGYHNGFFRDKEEQIVAQISRLKPTYLFLGLPSPMKEEFIFKHKRDLDVGLLYGVGGVFDIKGGKVNRAPCWVQRINMEWFFRILLDPSYYGTRFFKSLPRFLGVVLKGKTRNAKCNKA